MSVRRLGTRRGQAGLPMETIPQEAPRRSGTRRATSGVPGAAAGETIPPVPVTRSGTKKVGIALNDNVNFTGASVPPRRGTTKRSPGTVTKKGNDGFGQGMKELYPNDPRITTDMDIVFVPGLGAHPENSWRCRGTEFNWVSNKEGLARDFPRARILLYMFESSWTGGVKVKQTIRNLASTLLDSLTGIRPDHKKVRSRPIVFVGHSMGGLVIAKAVVLAADSQQQSFPKLFENIAGCIFFGTPFGGAPAADIAVLAAHLGERFDLTVTTTLLELMKPDSEPLYDLRNDFVRCVGKLSQRIKLFSFYEQLPTDAAKMMGLPMFSGLFKMLIPTLQGIMVNQDSATLTGLMDSMAMNTNHRDLVRFESFKDRRYTQMRRPFKEIIHSAHLVVKNRLNSTRDIDREMVKSLMDVLDGAQVAKKRKTISQSVVPSEWIPREAEYVNWLAKPTNTPGETEEPDLNGDDCLWIYGSEGRGKTGAALAALDDIEEMIINQEKRSSGDAPIILAYFFCDTTPDYNTAEDLLKSLVRQLISRQEMLATYAKQFIRKKGLKESQALMTVENLWQTLREMLADEDIGSRVYLVIHNLHTLPDCLDSTKKFMFLFQSSLQTATPDQDGDRHTPIRWLLTSRPSHLIKSALTLTAPTTPSQSQILAAALPSSIRKIDLENSKYATQIHHSNRRHAASRIRDLATRKGYSRALAYFATSLIGRRAQNTQWIDVACVGLDELEEGCGELVVRGVLEGLPGDLDSLLRMAWEGLMGGGNREGERIKSEVLRVMLLGFEEEVSVEELGVLVGGDDGSDGDGDGEAEGVDLAELVDSCKPFLEMREKGKDEGKVHVVGFMSLVVKKYLLDNAEELLGLTEEKIKWQHGVVAHRAFSHIIERCWVGEDGQEEGIDGGEGFGGGMEEEFDGEMEDEGEYYSDWDSGDDGFESTGEEPNDETVDPECNSDPAGSHPAEVARLLPYTVKHWLHHASKATSEIAEELSLEDEFWKPNSPIRGRWLKEYNDLTKDFLDDFGNFDPETMPALHVASSIGFSQLVGALIKNGYADQVKERDATHSTPLHYAAWFGRPHIVEVLLDNNAPVDDGSDVGELTPLHMAACKGNVEVMERLLKSKADPNAMCDVFGPVINGAIMSGNRKAVELLVDAKAELSLETNEFESPLALATLFPDKSMFDYLIKSCSDKLPDKEYEKALIKAAEEGRVDIFEQLISADTVQYTRQGYEKALRVAERELSWDIIRILLTKEAGLNCIDLFTKAATGTASQDQILTDIWEYTQHRIPTDVLNKCLYRATDLEKESTVELLLSFNADPNTTGQEYGNALTAAAFDGTIDIVKKLISAGADVNSPNGWPLHAAAAGGHLAVVTELLSRGAEINRVLSKGQRKTNLMIRAGTALQAACEAGKGSVVDLLLQHGADPNLGPQSAHNGGSSTCPLIVASRKGEKDIFEALVRAGAVVDVFGGPERTTPLINATLCLPKESLELLLEKGANINLADRTGGDTALIVASRKGDADLVGCLLQHGADILHSNRRGENALQAAALASREECLRVLIQHVSGIMASLKKAIDSGDTAVTRVVRGLEKEEKKEKVILDIAGNEKEVVVSVVSAPALTPDTTVITSTDDSSKIVVTADMDMPDYMIDNIADVDDMGIPFALPSLGLPNTFTPAAAPPSVSSPPPLSVSSVSSAPPPSVALPPPPTQTYGTATISAPLTYRPPQDIRAWTPDSAPFGAQSNDNSRASTPAMIRRKPPAGGVTISRKNTGPNGVPSSAFVVSKGQHTPGASFDQTPPVSHTPPPSVLGNRSSIDQDATGRVLTDSPQPMQDGPFVPPPAPPSSPPKQTHQLPSQRKESLRRDTGGSTSQPPAYAALVAANFRSQSQSQLPQSQSQSQPQLLRQTQSSTQLHLSETSALSSPAYTLRSLYSVPASSASPPLTSTSPNFTNNSSTTGLGIATGSPQHQQQQQRDQYTNFQQRQQQKIEAYSSFHERLRDNTHPQQQSPSSRLSWTMQVGNETAEQAVMHMHMGSPQQHEQQMVPLQGEQQIPSVVQPKILSPPVSYDGEGWGDSPVAEDIPEPLRPQVVDVRKLRHARTE